MICQFRFPAILKIDVQSPVAFQEEIRTDFPLYKSSPTIQLGIGLPPSILERIGKDLPFNAGHQSHEFSSKEGNWTLLLTKESIRSNVQEIHPLGGFSRASPKTAQCAC